MATDLKIQNLIVPYACERNRYAFSGIQSTMFSEMPVSDVYDMQAVTQLHQEVGVRILAPHPNGKRGKCGHSVERNALQAVGEPHVLNLTFSHEEMQRLKGGWEEWVRTFWSLHATEIEAERRKIPSSYQGPIALLVRPKGYNTWGFLSTNCPEGNGFCLHQPFPAESFMSAARRWPYAQRIQSLATKLQKKLGPSYGFFHLRAEADNIWGGRDQMLSTLKAMVRKRPHINWYVASGIFNTMTLPQELKANVPQDDIESIVGQQNRRKSGKQVAKQAQTVKIIVDFLDRVQAYRRSRSWCQHVSPGQRCGEIMVGDEMVPDLMTMSVELRSCIDQLIGRSAVVAAGISQSSMTAVLYGYRLLLHNNSKMVLMGAKLPYSYVDHVFFLPWYNRDFWEENEIKESQLTFPSLARSLHGVKGFMEPDVITMRRAK